MLFARTTPQQIIRAKLERDADVWSDNTIDLGPATLTVEWRQRRITG
jgi:hypothetical protein